MRKALEVYEFAALSKLTTAAQRLGATLAANPDGGLAEAWNAHMMELVEVRRRC